MKNMEVTTYGTGGSVPIARGDRIDFGGNTSCVHVKSDCLPNSHELIIDAGSGAVPLGVDLLKKHSEAKKQLHLHFLLTHYHPDHTQGLPLMKTTHHPQWHKHLYGPQECKVGPNEMMAHMMQCPFFPVDFAIVKSRFTSHNLPIPSIKVIAFHPEGGVQIMSIDAFNRIEEHGKQVPFGKKGKFAVNECLIVKMYRGNHPEDTISYRLEERPTGKVFVFLTDHENLVGLPLALRQHITGANLLIADAQYTAEMYQKFTAGYGHGTGPYCAQLASQCGVKRLGLTHHDPLSDDKTILRIVAEAENSEHGKDIENIFACADYHSITV